jgi:hypothetical protein
VGDSKVEVLNKCGAAYLKESVELKARETGRYRGNSYSLSTVDLWTYALGQGQFFHVLKIKNGKVKKITRTDTRQTKRYVGR